MMAQFSVTLNVLENWEQQGKDSTAKESFHTNYVKWVELGVTEDLLFCHELASSKTLSKEEKANSEDGGSVLS